MLSLGLSASDDEVRIRHFDERDGFTESYVTAVMQDSKGLIWVSSWNGLSLYDGYRFQTFKGRPGDNCPLATNRINGIAELSDHNILCKSNEQYYVFDRNGKRFRRAQSGVNKRLIKFFHVPKQVGERVLNLPEYRNIEVKFLCVDRQGGVWIQSNRGLERVWFVRKPISAEKYGSAGEESVRGLFVDSRRRVWIADKNGVVRVLPNALGGMPILRQHALFLSSSGELTPVPAVFGSNVYSFCEDKKGDLWLGTKPDGLYRLHPDGAGFKVTHYKYSAANRWSISDNNVYDIVENPAGGLFIATFKGGLNIMKTRSDGSVTFMSRRNVLRKYPQEAMQCRCLQLTPSGVLLIGTTAGLLTCRASDDASVMAFHMNSRNPNEAWTLGSNYIMGMLRTRGGEVLIATSGGGVDKIVSGNLLSDKIHFRHFSQDDGLSSDMTLALQEDPSGRVWVVAEASLSCVDPKRGESVNYMKGSFGGRFAFTEAQPLCLADGRLIAGTTQGTVSFNTLNIAKSTYVPNVVFNCNDYVEVDPARKEFSVSFAALDYNKNEDIVYAYKFDGMDSIWHYTTANELHYVGLSPGTYRLHVRSTNGDGIWVGNEKVITIHRRALFYETPYFWIMLGLLAAALLYLVYRVVVYIRRLQDEIKDIRLTSNEEIAMLANRVRELLSIREPVAKVSTVAEPVSDDDKDFAERLEAFILANIGNSDLKVDDMAQAMSVSRTVLYARIKKLFNSSPNNLLLNMRIDMARRLLGDGNLTVAEVAYKCGFSDPKYFSRCFKKLTGMKPTEWKK